MQGTNNENFWESAPKAGGGGGAAAAPTRLYAFATVIAADDPAQPRQRGRLAQYLLGRQLRVAAAGGGGGLELGEIFWATDAPPPDRLGFPLHSRAAAPAVRADMAAYLGSLLSEYVPGESAYNSNGAAAAAAASPAMARAARLRGG